MNRAPTHAFSRRTFLGRGAGSAAAVAGASAVTALATETAIGVGTSATSQAAPAGTLNIPPLLSPDVVDGVSVYTLGITNHLGAESTVHFHGAHVPAKDDGGPQFAFADGHTWSPSFTVNQNVETNTLIYTVILVEE
jgi:FtsP/CotA-like multicopper oxidase with cupredoxin domain